MIPFPNMAQPIRFKFAAEKAYAALRIMLSSVPSADLHTVLKACYFADKAHLNKYGRPIFGATYRAMKFGPVPLEIYEMAKGEALWLAELQLDSFPWAITGHRLSRLSDEPVDTSTLSQTDLEALEGGFLLSRRMTFNQRTAATHGSDWQAAKLGFMRYEDMIEEGPDKAERVAYLREAGPYMRL
jgi:hypothetical protein